MAEKITLKNALANLPQKTDVDSIVATDASGNPVYIKKADLAQVVAELMSLGTRINKGLTYNALTCDEISIDNIENVADSMISPSCALFNVSACETTPVGNGLLLCFNRKGGSNHLIFQLFFGDGLKSLYYRVSTKLNTEQPQFSEWKQV